MPWCHGLDLATSTVYSMKLTDCSDLCHPHAALHSYTNATLHLSCMDCKPAPCTCVELQQRRRADCCHRNEECMQQWMPFSSFTTATMKVVASIVDICAVKTKLSTCRYGILYLVTYQALLCSASPSPCGHSFL